MFILLFSLFISFQSFCDTKIFQLNGLGRVDREDFLNWFVGGQNFMTWNDDQTGFKVLALNKDASKEDKWQYIKDCFTAESAPEIWYIFLETKKSCDNLFLEYLGLDYRISEKWIYDHELINLALKMKDY